MRFGVTKFARLCRWTAFTAYMTAVTFHSPFAPANQAVSAIQVAQSYYPAGEYEAREIQPALSPLTADQLESGGVLLWASNVRHQEETQFIALEVQPDLSLGAAYNHHFTLNLEAQKDIGGRAQVPDGWYQINLAVVKQKGMENAYQQATLLKDQNAYDRFVTFLSQVHYIAGGRLVRTFTLRVPNITAAALKNHLYVQLIPLAKECVRDGAKFPCINTLPGKPLSIDARRSIPEPLPGVTPYLIEMPFVPLRTAGSADGGPQMAPGADDREITGDLGKYISEARQYQALKSWGRSGMALKPADYAQQSGLVLVSLADGHFRSRYPKADAVLSSLFTKQGVGTLTIPEMNPELNTLLCDLLSDYRLFNLNRFGVGLLSRAANEICTQNVDQYFSITRITHFPKLNGQKPPRLIENIPTTFALMANFMLSRSRTDDISSSYALTPLEPIKKVIGTFVKPIEAFGISSVLNWTYSLNRSNARSQSESALGAHSISLDFNVSAFDLHVVNATQCLEIRLSKLVLANAAPGVKQGLYLCGNEQRDLTVKEIYVHAYSYHKDTSTAEAFSPNAQAVNYSFRGDRDITMFFRLIRSRLSADHNSQDFPFYTLEKVNEFFGNRPSAQAMMVAQPIAFQVVPPSLAMKLFGRGAQEKFMNDD